MSKYGDDIKQVCFEGKAKLHADLKIRLHYDGLSQQRFFSEVVTAYLEKDTRMIDFIFDVKERLKVQTAPKRKKVRQLHEKSLEAQKSLGLSEGEIENIFDIIEQGGE